MLAPELPESITVRFKASVNNTPEDRSLTREWLAKATEGFPVQVIEGFTAIKPLPPRKEVKSRRRPPRTGFNRVSVAPKIVTDYALEVVGGQASLAKHLGLTLDAVRKWGVEIPERHELMVRELLRHWKKIARAKTLFSVGLSAVLVARQLDIPLDELFDLCTRFNVATHEQ